MENLKFIVTGTGRCGTVHMAKFLTSIGVPCTHEGTFNFEKDKEILSRVVDPKKRVLSKCSVNGFIKKETKNWVDPQITVADSSYLAVPYLSHPLVCEIPVLHVVRNPIKVISSFVQDFEYFSHCFPNESNEYDAEIYEPIIWNILPELSKITTQLERACWYYYRWNQIIEDNCKFRKYLRINIETFDKEEVCDFVGGDRNLIVNSFNEADSNTNKKNPDINVSSVPNGFFKNLLLKKSSDYGYHMRKYL